jgi:hypothetical protein
MPGAQLQPSQPGKLAHPAHPSPLSPCHRDPPVRTVVLLPQSSPSLSVSGNARRRSLPALFREWMAFKTLPIKAPALLPRLSLFCSRLCLQAARIVHRPPRHLQETPAKFAAVSEQELLPLLLTFLSRLCASPWSVPRYYSAADRRVWPTAEAPCRPVRLQPPLPLTSGSNRRSRSSSRAPLVELFPVVASSSLRSRRNTAGASHLHASPAIPHRKPKLGELLHPLISGRKI